MREYNWGMYRDIKFNRRKYRASKSFNNETFREKILIIKDLV